MAHDFSYDFYATREVDNDNPRAPDTFSRRPRRILDRQVRPNALIFDPEAPEFVPTMPTSSRRKASSSAKSGKSVTSSSRTPFGGLATRSAGPIIKSKDLFGTSQTSSYHNAFSDIIPNLSELESEDEIADLPALFAQHGAYTYHPQYAYAQPSMATPLPMANTQGMANPQPTAFPQLPVVNHQRPALQHMIRNRRQQDNHSETPSRYAVALVYRGYAQYSYMPLCAAPVVLQNYNNDFAVLPDHLTRIDQHSRGTLCGTMSWPADEVPVEMFDLITQHLSRDDVKSMRMVNHEFERKVSRSLFHTSVVPFNTELYDMLDEETKKSKGKGKAKAIDQDAVGVDGMKGSLLWKNAKEDQEGKVYKGHGLRVFQGFGPHIKRFGMSFEVSEDQLATPPAQD